MERATPVRRSNRLPSVAAVIAAVIAALTLAVAVTGCGNDPDAGRAERDDRSSTTTSTSVTTTVAPAPTAAPATAPPTTAPAPPAPTTIAATEADQLEQQLESVGSSLDAAGTANDQADPDLARRNEGAAP
jgi:cytoskeletal protein RodZ